MVKKCDKCGKHFRMFTKIHNLHDGRIVCHKCFKKGQEKEQEIENSFRNKEIEDQKYIDKIDRNITIYNNDKLIDDETYYRRRDVYTISGVDKADFHPEMIKRQRLTRPIEKMCPICANMLYNTKLDGIHFYCPNCKRQYHKNEIK